MISNSNDCIFCELGARLFLLIRTAKTKRPPLRVGSDDLKGRKLQSIFTASIIFSSSILSLTKYYRDQIIPIEQYEGLYEVYYEDSVRGVILIHRLPSVQYLRFRLLIGYHLRQSFEKFEIQFHRGVGIK